MNITFQKLTALLFLLGCSLKSYSQTISGKLSYLANQEISLEGFNGLKSYAISKTMIDEKGNFKLAYSSTDLGVGYLKSIDNKPLYLILNGEDIEIMGESLSNSQTIKITKGKENQWFEQYANEHPRREQALSAWDYLEKIYTKDSLFTVQAKPLKAILKEKQRIQYEDLQFLSNLPVNSYVGWYLPVRKLMSSVSTVAQYRTQEIPSTIQAFRALDYTDKRFYKSGLYQEAIESHFWLLENCGKPLDSIFFEMQLSIDAMMKSLVKNEQKLNEVTNYLFDLLERHSLFNASEYLAIKVLNQSSCTINSDLAKQLETYRAMKKGNIAPNIVFPQSTVYPSSDFKPSQLIDIKSDYTLIVFGASWCPKCKEEVPEIGKNYNDWKKNGLEVVFVSLDENELEFISFSSELPFISMCDFQKWNSPIAQNYYVFGTPTMYLLDKQQKIILRPNSIYQVKVWVDWYLIQGNSLPSNK